MTLKTTKLITAFLLSSVCNAQNLVLNPSLENYITCPGFGQFSSTYINNWSKPTIASTDYYNSNCTGIQPTNQAPHTGDAYFGIIAFNYSGEYREYATAQLSSPLVAGIPYIVTFYVSLNDGYIQAVNELGAYLSATAPGPYGNALHIPVTPQVENTAGVLGSDSTWMFISGNFVATGGEQFLTIGNFHDDASTTVTQVGNVGSYGAYYYVDDVSVKSMETGIELAGMDRFSVYPNPVKEYLQIQMDNNNLSEIYIYDISNRKIAEQIFSSHLSLNFEDLSAGLYFYQITNKENSIQGRFIKQ